MSHIAVFFTAPDFDGYPFHDPIFRDGYHEIGGIIAELNHRFSIVRGPATYNGKNTFASGWEYQNGAFKTWEGRQTVDLIWNRGEFPYNEGAKVQNEPAFDAVCWNKWSTYLELPDAHPRSILIERESNIELIEKELQTDPIVFKPVDSFGGQGVFLYPRSELSTLKLPSFPYLAQEHIDMSEGVPGFVEGRHDLRIIMIKGTPSLAFLRIPKKGGVLANVSQGGSVMPVPLARIPARALTLAKTVDAKLSHFPNRLFGIDMARNKGDQWKMMELNSQPGLMGEEEVGDEAHDHNRRLAEYLISCL